MEYAGEFDEQAWERQLRHGGSADGVHIEAADIGVSMIWIVDRSEQYLASIKPEYRGERILIRVVERGPERWEVTSIISGQGLGEFHTREDAFRYGRAYLFLDAEGK